MDKTASSLYTRCRDHQMRVGFYQIIKAIFGLLKAFLSVVHYQDFFSRTLSLEITLFFVASRQEEYRKREEKRLSIRANIFFHAILIFFFPTLFKKTGFGIFELAWHLAFCSGIIGTLCSNWKKPRILHIIPSLFLLYKELIQFWKKVQKRNFMYLYFRKFVLCTTYAICISCLSLKLLLVHGRKNRGWRSNSL